MSRFGIKWAPRDDEGAKDVPQVYPYRTREQAEGEVRAARMVAPEVFANRSYEIVEEP